MYTVSEPCPRCGHEKSILTIIWASEPIGSAQIGDRETLGKCVHCEKHCIVIIRTHMNAVLSGAHAGNGDVSKFQNIDFVRTVPEVDRHEAPEDVPARVAQAFVEGKAILARGMWTPAAGSFRTSLDRATQILWAGLGIEEETPFKMDRRLKKLAEKLFIPASMMEWADTVRVVGNDMHEIDEVSQEDAADAAHFVETFLTYMFTLPARVARFKARRQAE
jgi:hypothetical protein